MTAIGIGISLIIAFVLGYALGRVNTLLRYKKKAMALLVECKEKGLSSLKNILVGIYNGWWRNKCGSVFLVRD